MNTPIILDKSQIESELKNLSGWAYADNKISKEFKFDDFMAAFNFIADLTPYFESIDHHPDMHIYYNRIVFELQRFDIGGKVTDRDLEVAHEIEKRHSKIKKQ